MGMTAALKLRTITENVRTILIIELLAATQALEFAKPLQPGEKLRGVYRKVREIVPRLEDDAPFTPMIDDLTKDIRNIFKMSSP